MSGSNRRPALRNPVASLSGWGGVAGAAASVGGLVGRSGAAGRGRGRRRLDHRHGDDAGHAREGGQHPLAIHVLQVLGPDGDHARGHGDGGAGHAELSLEHAAAYPSRNASPGTGAAATGEARMHQASASGQSGRALQSRRVMVSSLGDGEDGRSRREASAGWSPAVATGLTPVSGSEDLRRGGAGARGAEVGWPRRGSGALHRTTAADLLDHRDLATAWAAKSRHVDLLDPR